MRVSFSKRYSKNLSKLLNPISNNLQIPVSPPMSPIMSPTFGQNQLVKTVTIGGTQKQIVSQQFNSPLNIYSDDAIALEAASNQDLIQSK